MRRRESRRTSRNVLARKTVMNGPLFLLRSPPHFPPPTPYAASPRPASPLRPSRRRRRSAFLPLTQRTSAHSAPPTSASAMAMAHRKRKLMKVIIKPSNGEISRLTR